MPRLVGFALRPEVGVAFGVAHVGGAEIEPLLGLGRVVDLQGQARARRDRLGKHRLKVARRRRKAANTLRRATHVADGEVDRVEPQHLKRRCQHRGGDRGGAGDGLFGKARGHIERDVRHVDLTVGQY